MIKIKNAQVDENLIDLKWLSLKYGKEHLNALRKLEVSIVAQKAKVNHARAWLTLQAVRSLALSTQAGHILSRAGRQAILDYYDCCHG